MSDLFDIWDRENRRVLGRSSIRREERDMLPDEIPDFNIGDERPQEDDMPVAEEEMRIDDDEARAPPPELRRRADFGDRGGRARRGGGISAPAMEQIDAESARVRAPPPLKYDESAKSKERCIGVEQYDSNKDPLARFNSKYKSPTETKDEMKKVREEINERASRKAERAAVRSAPKPAQESKPVPAKTTDMWGNLGQ